MQNESERIDVIPSKFDEEWRVQLFEFEATFIYGDALNRIGFAIDANRVWGEWLFARLNQSEIKSRRFFQKEYDSMTRTYFWTNSKKNEIGKKCGRNLLEIVCSSLNCNSTEFYSLMPNNYNSSFKDF